MSIPVQKIPGIHRPMIHKSGKEKDIRIVQCFEIDFSMDIDEATGAATFLPYISLYDRIDLDDPKSACGYKDVFAVIEDYHRAGTFRNGTSKVPESPRNPDQPRMTALSLNGADKQCTVIKIHDRLNCTFDTRFWPFTAAEPDDLCAVYSDASLIYLDNGRFAVLPDRPNAPSLPPALPATKWAYFFFDAEAAKTLRTASGTSDGAGNYVFALNFHVELIDARTKTRIAITIDPDVGHPGGKGGG